MFALLARVAARVWAFAPDWYAGRPPAYPGQYAGLLYHGVTTFGLGGGVLLSMGAQGWAGLPRWRRSAAWALIALGIAGVALQIWHSHQQPT
jgi:hypothetical protein